MTTRRAGRISGWKDDKGYGFVMPHDGGERAFVHIRALQTPARRPVDGDLISYVQSRDARGRINATDVRFAGQRIERRRSNAATASGWRLPRALIGTVVLLGMPVVAAVSTLPVVVPAVYWLLGGVSYLMYWFDKAAAQRGGQRVAENTLHLVDLFGGWAGALIAQRLFRHKTIKSSFQRVFWATVVANVGMMAWLLHSGFARWATNIALGL